MNMTEYLKGLRRSSKSDDIPGTVISYLDEICPVCKKKMKLYKPCCGSPKGHKGCVCGYKIQL